MRTLLRLLLLPLIAVAAAAQSGANRADATWRQFETEHFTFIFHEELRGIAQRAADIAEAIYPVVTGNLNTQIPGRTPIYISDLENVRNAFAFSDHHIYLWMQGIQDDGPVGGLRASGSAKWLRAVITHEFTHTVIAHATRSWSDLFIPTSGVPRWFNEGTARFMEPDRWTPDIDMVLRLAAVNGRTSYSAFNARLDGALLYEGGHSLVRYMTWRFGDTILSRIVAGGRSGLSSYDFNLAVRQATGMSMSDIYNDWLRAITVYYGIDYGSREETSDIAQPLVTSFSFVPGYRYSRDGRQVAMLAGGNDGPLKLLVGGCSTTGGPDTARPLRVVCDDSGIDSWFDWSPDGERLIVSKLRRGSHSAAVNDLYVVNTRTGHSRRLTDDANVYDPSWRPDGSSVAAVQRQLGLDRIVLVDVETGAQRSVFDPGEDIQIANLSWSPDGSLIAFSLFDSNGARVLGVLTVDDGTLRRVSDSESIARYPVWSPDGTRLAFTTTSGGIPNVAVVRLESGTITRVTDVAGGVYTVGWLPGTDSIVAMSLDTRDKLVPYLLPASRSVTPAPRPHVREKYSAWRNARFPRSAPPQNDIRHAATGSETGYTSIAHLSTMGVVPAYGTDRSVAGRTSHRLGIGLVLAEPIGLQQAILFGDYGFASHEPGGLVAYRNTTLPFSITATAFRRVAYARELLGVAYQELSIGSSLALSLTLTPPNDIDEFHSLYLRGGFRRIEPFNTGEFERAALRPGREELAEVGLTYSYRSPSLLFTGSFTRSEPDIGSTLKFNRLESVVAWRWGIFGDDGMRLAVDASFAAGWGTLPVQEFIGLDPHDDFAGGIDLATQAERVLLDQPTPIRQRVRGIRRFEPGDRAAVGSIGFEFPDGPMGGSFLLFAEAGSAWFSDTTPLDKLQPQKGYGLELRSPIAGNIMLATGVAFEMIEGAKRDLYIRLMMGI